MKVSVLFNHPRAELGANGKSPLLARAAAAKNALKMRLVAETRHRAFVEARRAMQYMPQGNFAAKEVAITWFYKGVRPDVDGVVTRCKALIDGCCDAFGVNDRELELGRVRRVHSLHEMAGTVELEFADELGV